MCLPDEWGMCWPQRRYMHLHTYSTLASYASLYYMMVAAGVWAMLAFYLCVGKTRNETKQEMKWNWKPFTHNDNPPNQSLKLEFHRTHSLCALSTTCQWNTCCTADASSTLQLVPGISPHSSSQHCGRRNNTPTNQWARVCTRAPHV